MGLFYTAPSPTNGSGKELSISASIISASSCDPYVSQSCGNLLAKNIVLLTHEVLQVGLHLGSAQAQSTPQTASRSVQPL